MSIQAKEKYYTHLSYSMLLLSLGVLTSWTEIEAQGEVIVREVQVSESMEPTSTVPRSLPTVTLADEIEASRSGGSSRVDVQGASTGVSGSNPGNANTGGTQVQNVTVSTSASPSLNSEVTTDSLNRSSLMRAERQRQEKDNEDRLLEKIERGRLEDERMRSAKVNEFDGVTSRHPEPVVAPAYPSVTHVPVYAIDDSDAEVVDGDSKVLTTKVRASDDRRGSRFSIVPFVGYQWMLDDGAFYDLSNMFLVGISLEGSMNRYISLMGSFSFSRDSINDRFYMGPMHGGGGYGYGGGSQYYGQTGVYGNQGYGINPISLPDVRHRDNFEVGAGVKLGYPVGMLHPYGTAGIGAVYSRYNIDNEATLALAEAIGWQRATTKMVSNFGLGSDFRLTDSMSLGAKGEYQWVISQNAEEMDRLYGDASNSFRLIGNFMLRF